MSAPAQAPDYFALRRCPPDSYQSYELPAYIQSRLPKDKAALIIDYGCGWGQVLKALQRAGYTNIIGLDINAKALDNCRAQGLNVMNISDGVDKTMLPGKAEFILMSHVLEHMPKTQMIPALQQIHSLLSPTGTFMVCVPNAQSATGSYWAYEDFTHEYLFTSGSLYYVLKAAGFNDISFVDIECLEGIGLGLRLVRTFFLKLYKLNYIFWNRITSSGSYANSEMIFSYEIKATCRA